MISKNDLKGEDKRWRDAVAAVLSATRRDADLTQEVLAAKIGWTRGMVAKAESGRRAVEFGEIVKIARACKTDSALVIRRIVGWN